MQHKYAFTLFFISLPVAVVIRILQLLYMIEPATGFFKPEFASIGTGIGIGLGILALLFLIFSIFRNNEIRYIPKRSVSLSVLSFALAATQLAEIFSFVSGSEKFTPAAALGVLFLLGSAAFFILLGVSRVTNFSLPAAFSLFPVFLWVYQLITSFMHYTGIANISENLFDVAMLCFTLLFLLNQAKMCCGVGESKSVRWALGSGLTAALFCAVTTLPRYAVILLNHRNVLHESTMPSPVNAAMLLYIVVFLVVTFARRKGEEDPGMEAPDDGLVGYYTGE